MRPFSALIALVIAVLTFAAWGYANRPQAEPPWPLQVAGLSFSPMHADEDPIDDRFPSVAEIDADLALLRGKVRAVRTYSMRDTLAEIPRLAQAHGIKVTLGAWLSPVAMDNDAEVAALIRVARAYPKVVERVIVGNEAVLRGDLGATEVTVYLDRVRKALPKVPVSTAEPWHVWLKHPELAAHADFIAAHMLPYWEGVALERAVDKVVADHAELVQAFPKKPVLIAEVGWPSNGRTLRAAVASESNEATFLRRFLSRAHQLKLDYFLMEAFDQPWKRQGEGAVGAYWGVYDVERQPKFAFTAPVVPVPGWQLLAGVSVGLGLLLLATLLVDGATLGKRGRSFLALTAFAIAATLVWAVYEYANQYLTAWTVAVGLVLALGFLGVVAVVLTEAHEWAETGWVTRRRRAFAPATVPAGAPLPKVSIHVPAYNEPPQMLIGTLDALARLDYPDFEVLVIDNNTRDEAVWRPVEAHCARLGPRFRFFHVAPLAGFKAGALNYALARTDPAAAVVAVIDSDYQVESGWLRDLVPHFARPQLAIMQAPQDYRDAGESAFKAMCHAEYRGFFHIGMVTRNERNAIIQHGTMTMVRTRVLRAVGGWAEWCITEDAELGLRIFAAGHEAGYIERSYGRGLMPDTFGDYRKQRSRWAYGAVQILRRHAGVLLRPGRGGLSAGQRYHFLAGWLPWLADGLNLFYTAAALAWSLAIVVAPRQVDPPLALFCVPPLALFAFKLVKMVHLYLVRLRAGTGPTLGAALAGLALSHTIAKAVVNGFVTRDRPFFRTPKCEHRPALVQGFLHAAEESVLALALWLAATGVYLVQGADHPEAVLWAVVLLVQSLPYLAALALSLVSAWPADGRAAALASAPRPLTG